MDRFVNEFVNAELTRQFKPLINGSFSQQVFITERFVNECSGVPIG
jgi:hypothetical protein